MNIFYGEVGTVEKVEKTLKSKELFNVLMSIIVESFDDDDEKGTSMRNLMIQYNKNEELREGIDLAMIAMTGYCMKNLIEIAEDFMKED